MKLHHSWHNLHAIQWVVHFFNCSQWHNDCAFLENTHSKTNEWLILYNPTCVNQLGFFLIFSIIFRKKMWNDLHLKYLISPNYIASMVYPNWHQLQVVSQQQSVNVQWGSEIDRRKMAMIDLGTSRSKKTHFKID